MILHAACEGEGRTLALLHGLYGRGRNLGGVARSLRGRWRVISIDLRNHGASPAADGMGYAAMAGDVIETLAAADALPATLLGHSMGGKTAMAAALLHPGEVERLVVGDIAPVAYAHGNARILDAMMAIALRPGLSRGAAEAALADAVPDAAVRGYLLQNLDFRVPAWRIGLRQIAAAIGEIEGWPAALAGRRYDGPATFVRGALSDYAGPAQEAAILAAFPAACIRTVAGAGHWLHVDNPDGFLRATGL